MIKKSLILIVLIFSVVFAQNYQDCVAPLWYFQNFSSTNSALANNTTAHNSGLAALSSNPAALGMESNTILGFSIRNNNLSQDAKFNNTYDLVNSNYTTSDLISNNFDGLGLILPIPVYQGSLVFGFSYSQIAVYNNQVDIDGTFSYDDATFSAQNLYDESGLLSTYRMGFAVEFQKDLYIGSSINFYSGERTQDYNYLDTDNTDVFSYQKISKNIKVIPEYGGMNFNIGLMYNKGNYNFGATFSSPFTIYTVENYKSSETWNYDDGSSESYSDDDKIKYDIKVPSSFSFGIGYNMNNIKIMADIKTQDWHNIQFDSKLYDYEYDDNGDVSSKTSTDTRINSEIRNNLTQTLDYGVSLVAKLKSNVNINVGHRIINFPYYDLNGDEQNIHLTGIGIDALLFDMLEVGVSYQFEMGKNNLDREFFEYPVYQKYNSQNVTFTTSLIF